MGCNSAIYRERAALSIKLTAVEKTCSPCVRLLTIVVFFETRTRQNAGAGIPVWQVAQSFPDFKGPTRNWPLKLGERRSGGGVLRLDNAAGYVVLVGDGREVGNAPGDEEEAGDEVPGEM